MPYQQMPTFKAVPDKLLELPQPGIGGLNLKDLEFEQEVNQSPYMLNMMYRNGAFSKRYGQNVHATFTDKIYATVYYNNELFVHSGTKIYKYREDGQHVDVTGPITLSEKKGLFIVFAQKLYYLISDGFYQYDNENETWGDMETYIPEVYYNVKPDGTHYDIADDYNILGRTFKAVYNGESGVSAYKVPPEAMEVLKWNKNDMVVEIDDVVTTAFNLSSKADRTINFNTAPPEGNLNVVVTFTLTDDTFTDERTQLLGSRFYETYGGSNNSRLFLAGGGKSKYFYSDAYDISNFPESNFATLGNTEEDITGFGKQYNILIVFKPREIYSIYSYVETAQTTVIEENLGLENFKSQLVNPRVGCDAPYSIQLINNQLTWFNSNEGVCTLVSTNIVDERNVRVISRNIERTNNFDVMGILDLNEDPATIQSADYNYRYFLVFPEHGYCYMWDYEISPYRYNFQGNETPARALDWYLFDHFYAGQFQKVGKQLLYVSSHDGFTNKLVKLNSGFSDVNYDGLVDEDGELLESAPIRSYYMTPFFQFNAVEYLKNVKNIYVQCRGDTASVIQVYYYTEENLTPEEEAESIRLGGRLWTKMQWSTFQWFIVNHAYTFRRKCNLKKIQMASFYFENNEIDRDMSIAHIGLQYQIVKYVR